MITMTQIAKLTNVSQPTVSRVLNGHPNVAPEIRERVLACAKEHDYQFNALARSLQGGRTGLLGLMVPEAAGTLVGRIEQEIRNHNCSVLLLGCAGRGEQSALDTARRYRVDGMLAVPSLESVSSWRGYAKKLDVPVVAAACQVDGIDSVYADRQQAGAMVAQHLLEKGYSRFIFIGPEDSPQYKGFQETLTNRGLAARTEPLPDDNNLTSALDARFRRPFRTGIFAHSDQCALRLLSILRELGIQVPWRAGVIGFGDASVCPYLTPQLSSVSEPLDAIASQAVARLLYRLDHPTAEEIFNKAIPVELKLRETT